MRTKEHVEKEEEKYNYHMNEETNESCQHAKSKSKRQTNDYNFINAFIAFAIAKLLLAIICRESFVTSGSDCTSLNLFA